LDVQMAWEFFSFPVTLLPSESTFCSLWSCMPLFSCHLPSLHFCTYGLLYISVSSFFCYI
jgi:hypothetical protein